MIYGIQQGGELTIRYSTYEFYTTTILSPLLPNFQQLRNQGQAESILQSEIAFIGKVKKKCLRRNVPNIESLPFEKSESLLTLKIFSMCRVYIKVYDKVIVLSFTYLKRHTSQSYDSYQILRSVKRETDTVPRRGLDAGGGWGGGETSECITGESFPCQMCSTLGSMPFATR